MSEQWYKIVFQKNDENYLASCQSVKNEFHEIRMSSDAPVEVVLFSRDDNYKTETFYFSPECIHYDRDFLKSISATPCEQPNHVGLGLLEGSASSRTSIFGDVAKIGIPTR